LRIVLRIVLRLRMRSPRDRPDGAVQGFVPARPGGGGTP
jgi:hypothetical protein